MNRQKYNLKHREVLSHHQVQYEKALDGVIEGRLPPSYLHERFLKLKAVKGR